MSVDTLPMDQPPAIRVVPMPADTNSSGDIFGGWLMSQVDIAGSIAAYKHSGGRIATVAVNEFKFLKPVSVGDLVSIFPKIVHIGNTSIQVAVKVYAERVLSEYECHRVAEAVLTFVAIDEHNKPRLVPAESK